MSRFELPLQWCRHRICRNLFIRSVYLLRSDAFRSAILSRSSVCYAEICFVRHVEKDCIQPNQRQVSNQSNRRNKTVFFFFFSQKSSPGHGCSQSEISSCTDVVIRDGSGVMDDRVGRFRRGKGTAALARWYHLCCDIDHIFVLFRHKSSETMLNDIWTTRFGLGYTVWLVIIVSQAALLGRWEL